MKKDFRVTTEPGYVWACTRCLQPIQGPCIKIPGNITPTIPKEDYILPSYKVTYDYYCDDCAIKELLEKRKPSWLQRLIYWAFMGFRLQKKI